MDKPKKRHVFLKLLLLLALICAVLVYDSNNRLVTDVFSLGNERLPEDLEGLRIVHLSDLHARSFGKDNEKLISAIADARPDIICITGDLVDKDQARQEGYVRQLMAAITQIAPVYFVSGNHDWAVGWARELFDVLREYGVTVLRNEYVTYGRGDDYIVIAGMDDPNGLRDQKTPAKVVEEIRRDHPGKYILMPPGYGAGHVGGSGGGRGAVRPRPRRADPPALHRRACGPRPGPLPHLDRRDLYPGRHPDAGLPRLHRLPRRPAALQQPGACAGRAGAAALRLSFLEKAGIFSLPPA